MPKLTICAPPLLLDLEHDVDAGFFFGFGDRREVLALPRRLRRVAGDLDALAAVAPSMRASIALRIFGPLLGVVEPGDEVLARCPRGTAAG